MSEAETAGSTWARVGSTTASLVRLGIWSIFFLFLIGHFVLEGDGWQGANDTGSSIEMVASGDPRGFRAPLPPKRERELRIGWLGGSSLRTHRKGPRGRQEIPLMVATQLVARGNLSAARNQPVILSYTTQGQRIYGLYVTLLDALERDTDALVITLGPMLIYNTRAFNQHKWWFPAVPARLPIEAKPWLEYLLLSQPSDWANALIAGTSPLVRNQAELHELVSWIPDTLASRQPAKASKRPAPLQFWSEARARVRGGEPLAKHEEMLERFFDATPGSVNDEILDRMFALLRDAEIPVLVYVAPVDPEALQDSGMSEAIRSIEARMKEKKLAFERPGLKIIAENPGRTLEGLEFHDRVHLVKTGGLIDWLSRQIEASILAQPPEGQAP